MKKGLLFFFMIVSVLCIQTELSAYTIISTDITTSTTWTATGSPYWVKNTVTIASGVVLEIDPGVVVKFEKLEGYSAVKRKLVINGTLLLPETGDPVIFTSEMDDDADGIDLTGNGYSTGSPGDWGYLKFQTSGNILQNCQVKFGGIGRYSGWTPTELYSVWIANTTTQIQDCVISNNYAMAIWYQAPASSASAFTIDNNQISGCTVGIQVDPAGTFVTSPAITNNTISATTTGFTMSGTTTARPVLTFTGNTVTSPAGTGVGLNLVNPAASSGISANTISGVLEAIVIDNGSPSITNNILTGNLEFPLTQVNTSFPTYSGNTISGNTKQAIRVYGTIDSSGSWINVQSLGLPYHVEDGNITINSGATLTINAGVVVKHEMTSGYSVVPRSILVNGTLALPASGNRVYFTSDRDDTVGGDSNGDGTGTSPAAGDWGYIKYSAAGNVLQNAEIRYAGIGRYSGWTATEKYQIWVNGVVTTITGCNFRNAYETTLYYVAPSGAVSAPSITNNSIQNCVVAINLTPSSSFITSPTISGNTISATSNGIIITGAAAAPPVATISGNTISSPGTTGEGVSLTYPAATTQINSNTIESVLQGLVINNGSPSVTGNTFRNAGEFPLTQINTCFPIYSGNTITGNEKQAIRAYGTIASNGTWPNIQGLGLPYHIEDGSLTIASGAQLTINTGVVVKAEMTSGYSVTNRSIIVNGVLELPGSGNRVIFTSDRDDTVGGDSNGDGTSTSPASGDWGCIQYNAAGNVLENADLRYGGITRYSGWTPVEKYMVWVNGVVTTITNCIFRNGYDVMVYYVAPSGTVSNPSMTDNDISVCTTGIHLVPSSSFITSPLIADNVISAASYGINIPGVAAARPIATIDNNVITSPDGTGQGITLTNPNSASIISNNTVDYCLQGLVIDEGSPSVTDNVFINNNEFPLTQFNTSFPVYSGNSFGDAVTKNVKQAIRVGGTISANGTWPKIQGLIMPYHIEDNSLTIAAGATLTINAGVIVKSEFTSGYSVTKRSLIVNGILNSLGTASDKVIFTSERDDTRGGDSNGDGTATTPAAGDWGYIKYNNNVNIARHLSLNYGGIGAYSGWTAVDLYMMWVNNISMTVEHCHFDRAYSRALYYTSNQAADSTVNIYHNRFTNAPFGINFTGAASFTTTTNISYNYFSCGAGSTNVYLTRLGVASLVSYNNILNGTYGVDVAGAHGAFHIDHNNIIGNATYGVRNGQAPCVIADNNWWGHASGPTDTATGAGACDGTNAGTGDDVSEYVAYTPWSSTAQTIGLLDCGSAVQIACGQTLSYQTTDTGLDNVDAYACNPGLDEGGEEMVYYVDTPTTGSLQVHLTPLFGTNPDVFILDRCGEENCLAYGDTDAILTSVPAGRYYIVVDSTVTPAYFNISVSCAQPTFTPTPTPSPTPTQTPLAQLDCSGAVSLVCGIPHSGTTVGGDYNVSSYNCNGINFSGPEIVHMVTMISTGNLTLTLNTSSYLGFMVLSGCSERACIGWSPDVLTLNDLSAGVYYVVVDGILGNSGTYTITATCPGAATNTPVPTSTPTPTNTPTMTPTTPAPTNTPTDTPTNTPTWTPTIPVPTNTPTYTPTSGATDTPTPIPTDTPSSTATPGECINNGDVDNSGVLSSGDAQQAFYIALGAIQPTEEEACRADCNGDGTVSSGDAQGIFYAALGSGSCIDPMP